MQTPRTAPSRHLALRRTARCGALIALATLAVAATPTDASRGSARPNPTDAGRARPLNCPDSGIKRIESKIKYGAWQQCGTGISVSTRGLSVGSAPNQCPTFAVYEPPHDTTTPKAGFYTVPGATSPIVRMDFACANRYLFFFIPTGSQCTLTQTSNAGSVQNYIEIACDPRFRGLGNGEGEVHGDLPTGR